MASFNNLLCEQVFSDLTPWIAVAITLALSILVPLFTQIANNRFQLKQKKQEDMQKEKDEIKNAYYSFSEKVGACIGVADSKSVQQACAAVSKMYILYPKEGWSDLDDLMKKLQKYEWDKALNILIKINKTIAELI